MTEPDPALRHPAVRVTTFGDSNTDIAWSPAEPHIVARSYVSHRAPRLAPDAPHHPEQLAAMVEARWKEAHAAPIRVINHGIAGTTTGGGGHGGGDRTEYGGPNARTLVGGVTRFEAEVLGRGHPWSGGEPTSDANPPGPIVRVNAYVPGPADFAYVSLGTNDAAEGIPAAGTVENLAWMVETWTAAGLAPDHLVLTTLAPRTDSDDLAAVTPSINDGILALASGTGTGLIDLGAFTSPDGGRTWREPWMHIGDGVHYTTPIRAWIAAQLVPYIAARHLPAR